MVVILRITCPRCDVFPFKKVIVPCEAALDIRRSGQVDNVRAIFGRSFDNVAFIRHHVHGEQRSRMTVLQLRIDCLELHLLQDGHVCQCGETFRRIGESRQQNVAKAENGDD